MCQWAATNLCSAQCEETAKGLDAHEYQDRKYWLCGDAIKTADGWRPCKDLTGKHGREQVDIGSRRNVPCPVCWTVRDAEIEYDRALDDARARYNAAVAMAEARKDRRIKGSTMFTTYTFWSSMMLLASSIDGRRNWQLDDDGDDGIIDFKKYSKNTKNFLCIY